MNWIFNMTTPKKDLVFPDYDTHFAVHTKGDTRNYQLRHHQAGVAATKNRNCVIDCGAHVGIFSSRYAEQFKQVISVEPINTKYLRENTKEFSNVTIIDKAVGSGITNKYSTLPDSTNSGAWELHETPEDEESVKFETTTIDQITKDLELSHCDLIKMDIQGMEYEALLGSLETIKKFHPVLQIELPTTEIYQLLKDLGYYLANKVIKDHIFVWGKHEN